MELFDHLVLYEKSGTGHRFFSEELDCKPVPFLSEGQSQAEVYTAISYIKKSLLGYQF